jgi:hypothetical protein
VRGWVADGVGVQAKRRRK